MCAGLCVSYSLASAAVGWCHTAGRGPRSGLSAAPPGMLSYHGYSGQRGHHRDRKKTILSPDFGEISTFTIQTAIVKQMKRQGGGRDCEK